MATVLVNVEVDKELMVTCSKEPITIKEKKNIKFILKNPKYEFVGFLSPQDMKHKCFDVVSIVTNDGSPSVMIVVNKFCKPVPKLYRYELVFQKRGGIPGNLYNHDPQIMNIPT